MKIRPEQILRVHGYRKIAEVRPDIVEAAEQLAKIGEKLIDAEVHYLRVPVVEFTPDSLVFPGRVRFTSEAFHKYCAGVEEIAVFLLTTGNRLDAQVRQHIDEFELIEALFLESCGWLAVESITRLFARDLRSKLTREAKTLGMRLGPGYSYKIGQRTVDWPLEQQRELFQLFDGYEIPVTMLESCAMTPKLSRSGFFGIVPESTT